MNSGSETAVDSIVGLKWTTQVKTAGALALRWKAGRTELREEPAYGKPGRRRQSALYVDDGQKGGGINSLTSVGVKTAAKKVR